MRKSFVVFGWVAVSLVMLVGLSILWAGSAEQTAYVDPVPEPPSLSRKPGDFNFTVTPGSALIDVPIAVQLSGLVPGEKVVLRAQTHDKDGHEFRSWARYHADADGRLDLAMVAPNEGSYRFSITVKTYCLQLPIGCRRDTASGFMPRVSIESGHNFC